MVFAPIAANPFLEAAQGNLFFSSNDKLFTYNLFYQLIHIVVYQ